MCTYVNNVLLGLYLLTGKKKRRDCENNFQPQHTHTHCNRLSNCLSRRATRLGRANCVSATDVKRDTVGKMSALCEAVGKIDVEEVKKLLAAGHDPNGVRRLWNDAEDDDEGQPSRPLKMVVFRLSDALLEEDAFVKFAEIARLLLAAGADPAPARKLAELRYGDCSDSQWEALRIIMDAPDRAAEPAATVSVEGDVETTSDQAAAAADLYPDSFSIMSYNVLIPNSVDGWWIYKMYGSDTPLEDTKWEARAKLLHTQLLEAGTDILCLQEMAGESIDQDWEFLKEAGYDCAVYRKDRMRCVSSRCSVRGSYLRQVLK